MINLIYGDCLEKMKDIPDKSIDFILADIPYGTTQCKWDIVIPFDLMWEQLNRIIKNNGAIALFGTEPFSSKLRVSNLDNFKYDWIWEKGEATGHLNSKKRPLVAHEIISVFYKQQCNYYPIKSVGHERKVSLKGDQNTDLYNKQSLKIPYDSTERYPRSVFKFKKDKQKENYHPTQKPVELLEYLIKTYTLENETVLDFTMGSGSTGVATKNLGRRFIGIEKEEKYFKIAQERIL